MRLPESCTSRALAVGQEFIGVWRDVSEFESVVVACFTDSAATLYVDFSPEGIFTDSTLTFDVNANVNEVHRVLVTRPYFRIRILNDNGSNQTFLRATSIGGSHNLLSTPINSSIQQDADAILAKTIDSEIEIAAGRISGYSIATKFGRNVDVDAGSLPEDIWSGGGTYTGFPTGEPEELQVFSDSVSDTGTLTFTYLASTTSTAYQTASVTLQGTTVVNTGITAYRVHTAFYSSGNPTTLNVGEITIRHRTTTANVFSKMPIGTGQTYISGFTVPFGCTGLVNRLFARVASNQTATVEGALWVRQYQGSPRLRRPFNCGNTVQFEERPYGGLIIPALADIIVRVTNTFNANNIEVFGGYDIIVVRTE